MLLRDAAKMEHQLADSTSRKKNSPKQLGRLYTLTLDSVVADLMIILQSTFHEFSTISIISIKATLLLRRLHRLTTCSFKKSKLEMVSKFNLMRTFLNHTDQTQFNLHGLAPQVHYLHQPRSLVASLLTMLCII